MRPRTKETAILMLVDSIEAAARTIDAPNRNAFEQLVRRIVFVKMKQGQLDESGLTLEELRVVIDTLVETLVSVYHSRIKYPSDKPLPVDAAREREQAAEQTPEKPAVAARSA